MLGLSCCSQASLVGAVHLSSCGSQASRGGDFSCGVWAQELLFAGSRAQLRSCGAQAQSLHRMLNLPGPGIKPVTPALAGGFPFTVPPGKSYVIILSSGVSPPTVRFSESGSFRGSVFSEPVCGDPPGWSRQHPLERCYACFFQTKAKGSRKSFLHLISQDRKDQSVNLNRLPMYRQICSYKFSRRLSSPSGGQAETHQLPHQPTVLLDTFPAPFLHGFGF